MNLKNKYFFLFIICTDDINFVDIWLVLQFYILVTEKNIYFYTKAFSFSIRSRTFVEAYKIGIRTNARRYWGRIYNGRVQSQMTKRPIEFKAKNLRFGQMAQIIFLTLLKRKRFSVLTILYNLLHSFIVIRSTCNTCLVVWVLWLIKGLLIQFSAIWNSVFRTQPITNLLYEKL